MCKIGKLLKFLQEIEVFGKIQEVLVKRLQNKEECLTGLAKLQQYFIDSNDFDTIEKPTNFLKFIII